MCLFLLFFQKNVIIWFHMPPVMFKHVFFLVAFLLFLVFIFCIVFFSFLFSLFKYSSHDLLCSKFSQFHLIVGDFSICFGGLLFFFTMHYNLIAVTWFSSKKKRYNSWNTQILRFLWVFGEKVFTFISYWKPAKERREWVRER